jgi:N-acetylglutamate synthase-like GNAT family acetyltransferase
MIIRNATKEDVVQLTSLISQLGYQLTCEELKERIDTCSNTGIYNYLVAEIDGIIVGLCVFLIYPKFYKKANSCFLEILVVDARFRKQGIGAKLIESIEDVAQIKQCSSISLLSNLNRDKEVHDFYRNKSYLNEGQRAQLYLRKEL